MLFPEKSPHPKLSMLHILYPLICHASPQPQNLNLSLDEPCLSSIAFALYYCILREQLAVQEMSLMNY